MAVSNGWTPMRARDACWEDRQAAMHLTDRARGVTSRRRRPCPRHRKGSSANGSAAMDPRPAEAMVDAADSKVAAASADARVLAAEAAAEISAVAVVLRAAATVVDLAAVEAGATGAKSFSL